MNLGWQIAFTLHANPDKLESMLETILEGHIEDSQVRIELFQVETTTYMKTL